MTSGGEMRFDFGRNWEDFVKKRFSEERVETSRRHLLDFLGVNDLKEHTFLDIGCGSGIHSLAAFRSGAKSVYSFDYDANSVRATRICHELAGGPANWSITQGSVLDENFLEKDVPKASLVYSWGVLHHTGDVRAALQSAASRVLPGGLFYIALYSADADVRPSPEYWLKVKQRYNRASPLGQQAMVFWYMVRHMGMLAIWRRLRHDNGVRGMSLLVDIRDWLGGWPMEYVRDAEVLSQCQSLGFAHIRTRTGEACHEYLFRRAAAPR